MLSLSNEQLDLCICIEPVPDSFHGYHGDGTIPRQRSAASLYPLIETGRAMLGWLVIRRLQTRRQTGSRPQVTHASLMQEHTNRLLTAHHPARQRADHQKQLAGWAMVRNTGLDRDHLHVILVCAALTN